MSRILIRLFLAAFCLTMVAELAHARGAIAVGQDGATGWCSGEDNAAKARSCAVEQCKIGSDTRQCEVAAECKAGYGAIAYGYGQGYGLLCNVDKQDGARVIALLACVRAAQQRCYLADTFPANGTRATADENMAFQITFYSQMALTTLNYYGGTVDGSVGPATKAALIKFQQATPGLPVSGEADKATLGSLIKAVGGEEAFTKIIIQGTDKYYDPSKWTIRSSATGGPAGTAPVAAAEPQKPVQPAPQPSAADPQKPIDLFAGLEFAYLKPQMEAVIEQSFEASKLYEKASDFQCQSATDDRPYGCTAFATNIKTRKSSALIIQVYSPKQRLTEAQAIDDVMESQPNAKNIAKFDNDAFFTPKGGGATQKFTFTCEQALGNEDSPAICFLMLTPHTALVAHVRQSRSTSPDPISVDGKLAEPDLDDSQTLLTAALAYAGAQKWPE